jgi:hypothetical protein
MFGTHDLLKLPHASAQLGRRTVVAHLRPYDLGAERDRTAFRTIAETLACSIGDPLPIDDGWLGELHAGSAGCVGLLVDWLLHAGHVHGRRGGRGSVRATVRAVRLSGPYVAEVQAELALGAAMIAGTPAGEPVLIGAHGVATRRGKYKGSVTSNGQKLKPGELRPRRVRSDGVASRPNAVSTKSVGWPSRQFQERHISRPAGSRRIRSACAASSARSGFTFGEPAGSATGRPLVPGGTATDRAGPFGPFGPRKPCAQPSLRGPTRGRR